MFNFPSTKQKGALDEKATEIKKLILKGKEEQDFKKIKERVNYYFLDAEKKPIYFSIDEMWKDGISVCNLNKALNELKEKGWFIIYKVDYFMGARAHIEVSLSDTFCKQKLGWFSKWKEFKGEI